jgi:hypothetical protein
MRGFGYSVVELNDVRHVFAAAVPRRGLTLRQQADDALRTIEAVIEEQGTRTTSCSRLDGQSLVRKAVPVETVILSGTMNTGKETVTRVLPAIPVKIIAAK